LVIAGHSLTDSSQPFGSGAFESLISFNGIVVMAGAEGFEPPLAVLETAGLPLNLRPFLRVTACHPLLVYLISLCGWCLRHLRQNLLISSRSVVVFLFLVLE